MNTPAFVRSDRTYDGEGKRLWRVTHVIRTVSKTFMPADQAALDRGTAVHQACRFYDEDGPNFEKNLTEPLDESLRGRLDAWIRFRREMDFTPLVIEKPIFMRALGYAGTPDRYGPIGVDLGLVEIKTGKPNKEDTRLQTIAYAGAIGDTPLPRIVVELRDNGTYQIHEYKIADWFADWRAWLGMLQYFNWLQRLRKETP